eukprot:2567232-Rhodomonas_salina.1
MNSGASTGCPGTRVQRRNVTPTAERRESLGEQSFVRHRYLSILTDETASARTQGRVREDQQQYKDFDRHTNLFRNPTRTSIPIATIAQRNPPKGPMLKRTYPAKRIYQDFRTLDATSTRVVDFIRIWLSKRTYPAKRT